MIGYLTGNLLQKKPNQVILDVNGIGFLLNISFTTFEKLPEIGNISSFYTYLNVREDDLSLFGFLSEEDKKLFEMLISINGIGPKLAIGMLSGVSTQDLVQAVANQDVVKLTQIPGVGRKTAERLIIELKDKLATLVQTQVSFTSNYKVRNDATAALVNLGFNSKKVEKIITDIISLQNEITIEELIKKSITLLNK